MEMLSDDMNLIERGRHQTREREVQKRREEKRRKTKREGKGFVCTLYRSSKGKDELGMVLYRS